MKRNLVKSVVTLAACISMVIPSIPVSAADYEFRTGDDGKQYWYEYGVKQGTVDDTQGILGDGTNRGREIYDPETNGWYWLDSCYDGAKAVGKEVWIPYIYQDELIMSADGNGRMANGISDEAKIRELAQASITSEADMSAQVEAAIRNREGKWVRYDENGIMIKGWVKIEGALAECYPDQVGNVYYYDQKTGLMAKGDVTINGVQYHFNEVTGVLDSGEMPQQVYICTSSKTYLKSNLKSETFYDERGNEVKTISYKSDGSPATITERQYDENGNCIYYMVHTLGEGASFTYYEDFSEYDADGNPTKSTIYYDKQLKSTTYVREVDEKGHVLKQEEYSPNGNLSSTTICTYEYSENGYSMIGKMVSSNSDFSVDYENVYTIINGKYCQTHHLQADSAGALYICCDNQFDDKGNIILQTGYNRDGSIVVIRETVNEYDTNGNLIAATETTKDSSGIPNGYVTVTVYEYSLVTR